MWLRAARTVAVLVLVSSFVDVVGGKAKREGEERRETRKHNVGKSTLDHGVHRNGRSDGGRDIRGSPVRCAESGSAKATAKSVGQC